MGSFLRNEVSGMLIALTLALIVGCTAPTRKKLACEDAGERRIEDACSAAISDVATMNACPMLYGDGYELHVCLDGSGLGCEDLADFMTDVECTGVIVACCPVGP